MKRNDQFILNLIAQIIFDKKGMNILVLDVSKFSSLTDFIIISEGSVNKHVSGISQAVVDQLKAHGVYPKHVEGMDVGDWVVLDYTHFMVHILTPAIREKYYLEELWRDGEIVDVSIDLSSSRSVGYVGSQHSVSF
ncbi:MAG: ribosome silencing factor [Alphaproteobacteria bacterium]|nr:ribosome silencing factor [Alphaproteobacteria bacterium]